MWSRLPVFLAFLALSVTAVSYRIPGSRRGSLQSGRGDALRTGHQGRGPILEVEVKDVNLPT